MNFGWATITMITVFSVFVGGILYFFYSLASDIQQVLWVIHTELFSIRRRMK